MNLATEEWDELKQKLQPGALLSGTVGWNMPDGIYLNVGYKFPGKIPHEKVFSKTGRPEDIPAKSTKITAVFMEFDEDSHVLIMSLMPADFRRHGHTFIPFDQDGSQNIDITPEED